MKVIMLINVTMPTLVIILTFIRMLNTTSGTLKAKRNILFLSILDYEQLKFQLS